MKAAEVMKRVQEEAKIKAKPDPVRYGSMAIDDFHRQGDVYIRRIASVPAGAKIVKKPSAQLAPGNTQGSRHCIASMDGITLYALVSPTPLDGPVIKADGQFTIEHPEHGHCTLPAGVYQVNYQRQYAEELRAVED